MSMKHHAALAVALWLLVAGSSFAGLYCPADQSEEILHPYYPIFRDSYLKFKNVFNDTLDTPLRRKALLVADLAPMLKGEEMTESRLLDVSAYLIRLKKYNEAIELLNSGLAQHPSSFLLQSNLGTAYLLASGGEDPDLLFRAIENLKTGYARWPASFAKLNSAQRQFYEGLGWQEWLSAGQVVTLNGLLAAPLGQAPMLTTGALFPGSGSSPAFDFHRAAEKYQWQLALSRKLELEKLSKAKTTKQKRALQAALSVDPLFRGADGTPVRFVGPSGNFEPGKIAEAELKKLPNGSLEQAILYVERLLLWMPLDDRLYWQLGELVNASGDTKYALEIFDTLAPKAKDLVMVKEPPPYDEFKAHHQRLREHADDLAKGSGKQQPDTAKNPAKTTTAPTPTSEDDPMLDRWRFFGVGLACGAVVALFGYWQLRGLLRRRRTEPVRRSLLHSESIQAGAPANLRRRDQS